MKLQDEVYGCSEQADLGGRRVVWLGASATGRRLARGSGLRDDQGAAPRRGESGAEKASATSLHGHDEPGCATKRLMCAAPTNPKAGALWARFRTLSESDRRDAAVVRGWASAKGFTVTAVEHKAVGRFQHFPATVVHAAEGAFCLPHQTPGEILAHGDRESAYASRLRSWEIMEWFHPAYVQNRFVYPTLKMVERTLPGDAVARLDHEITSWYAVPGIATSVCQLYAPSPALRAQAANIRECVIAYYSGFKNAAIGGLIPAVESGLRTLLELEGLPERAPVGEKVHSLLQHAAERAINELYFTRMWVPRAYESRDLVSRLDEYVYMLDVFERWLTKSFYSNTADYTGTSGLNRNYFAHGGESAWCRPTNFHRLLGVLDMICFVEAMLGRAKSALFPDPSDESIGFHDELLFRVDIQGLLPGVREARRAKYAGRLVPQPPADGGLALRLAILRTDASTLLTPALAAHGWRVTETACDETRETLVVTAVRGAETRRVAVLYTPASANETYRRLDGAVDGIFFRGEPYHLESYAFGISMPVHPLRDATGVIASWA